MLSYFLPPQTETPKSTLIKTIEFLEKQSIDETAFKLLNALASGLLWSEESDTALFEARTCNSARIIRPSNAKCRS